MKRAFLAVFVLAITVISCKKSTNPPPVDPPAEKFMSYTAGNQWTYEVTDNKPTTPVTSTYTLTATATDTTVSGGRVYKIFNNSSGINEYYAISGSEYYTYVGLPANIGDVKLENLYLKDNGAVSTSWSMNVSIPFSGISIPVTLTNKIEARGLTRTVNGIEYKDVIQVSTSISSSSIPASALTSDIDSYYAPKYGIIESSYKVALNYIGFNESVDTKTTLKAKNF